MPQKLFHNIIHRGGVYAKTKWINNRTPTPISSSSFSNKDWAEFRFKGSTHAGLWYVHSEVDHQQKKKKWNSLPNESLKAQVITVLLLSSPSRFPPGTCVCRRNKWWSSLTYIQVPKQGLMELHSWNVHTTRPPQSTIRPSCRPKRFSCVTLSWSPGARWVWGGKSGVTQLPLMLWVLSSVTVLNAACQDSILLH